MGRNWLAAAAVTALAAAPLAAHAQPAERVALTLPGIQGNDTNAVTKGAMSVLLKRAPAGGTFQVDSALYAGLDNLAAGQHFAEGELLVTTIATTTSYRLGTVTLAAIGIDAPNVTLTFSYGAVTTKSEPTPRGTF